MRHLNRQLVNRLVLVASSPQFVRSEDWPCAVDKSVINGFAADLEKDYRATVLRFLAIQTLGSEHYKIMSRVQLQGGPKMLQ